MNSTAKRLAMRLKRLREERGLTQERLAKRSGVSHGYLARLEIGMHDPSLSTLVKLAKALCVSHGELLGESPMLMEWWRAEPDRDIPPKPLSSLARNAPGSYFAREEAERTARRLGYAIVARYQDKGGGEVIRRGFTVREA